jgi:hypothetical protein
MNYYIIPRYVSPITIEPSKNLTVNPTISNSLLYYLNDVQKQIKNSNTNINDELTIDYISKIVNPHEFVNTIVPGSTTSVSKLNTSTNLYFELIEISHFVDIAELLPTNVAHITPNYETSILYMNSVRNINEVLHFNSVADEQSLLLLATNKYEHKIDFFICEFNPSDYDYVNSFVSKMLLLLSIITNNQKEGGACIIKIDHVFCDIIAEIILIFSAVYQNVFIIKPSVSDPITGHRFLICKAYSPDKQQSLIEQINTILLPQLLTNSNEDNQQFVSIISNEVPYFFLSKLNEINIIIGQQQLDTYDQIINIHKNKNKPDTIEALKRKHLQKCIQWCEKYNLPHNKFVEKINIFLNST